MLGEGQLARTARSAQQASPTAKKSASAYNQPAVEIAPATSDDAPTGFSDGRQSVAILCMRIAARSITVSSSSLELLVNHSQHYKQEKTQSSTPAMRVALVPVTQRVSHWAHRT